VEVEKPEESGAVHRKPGWGCSTVS